MGLDMKWVLENHRSKQTTAKAIHHLTKERALHQSVCQLPARPIHLHQLLDIPMIPHRSSALHGFNLGLQDFKLLEKGQYDWFVKSSGLPGNKMCTCTHSTAGSRATGQQHIHQSTLPLDPDWRKAPLILIGQRFLRPVRKPHQILIWPAHLIID